jgi:hypothetical protein
MRTYLRGGAQTQRYHQKLQRKARLDQGIHCIEDVRLSETEQHSDHQLGNINCENWRNAWSDSSEKQSAHWGLYTPETIYSHALQKSIRYGKMDHVYLAFDRQPAILESNSSLEGLLACCLTGSASLPTTDMSQRLVCVFSCQRCVCCLL